MVDFITAATTWPLSRRHAWHTLAALAAGLAMAAGVLAQSVPQAQFQAPGFYRFQLGAFEITALSDGTVPQQLDQLMHAPASQIQQLVGERFGQLPLETSMNAYLVHTGAQLLLVDTGAGHSFGPGVGNHLLRNLAAAGYAADQVDAILLTHIHGDHSGGLTDAQGRALFSNATVYVAQQELDHWFSDKEKELALPQHRAMFDAGRAALSPYLASGQVRGFASGAQLFQGVQTIASPGHTPGHTFFQLQSQGQTLVVWGDVVHAAEVQFPHPHITIDYDTDPAAAAKARLTAFARAAQQGYWVAAPHIAFPGIGHVRKLNGHYGWVPANYSLGQ